jgi:hypothetical protein
MIALLRINHCPTSLNHYFSSLKVYEAS